jgi:hypothetical protein
MTERKPDSYDIDTWVLDYDGSQIGRDVRSINIDPFDGEKEIISLEIFPCKYEDDAAAPGTLSRRRQLEDRGKFFFRLTAKHCMHYAGLTTTYPKRRVSSASWLLLEFRLTVCDSMMGL